MKQDTLLVSIKFYGSRYFGDIKTHYSSKNILLTDFIKGGVATFRCMYFFIFFYNVSMIFKIDRSNFLLCVQYKIACEIDNRLYCCYV